MRYAIVGLLNNMLGYLVYLLVTALGVGPKAAMTGLYLFGALAGYIGNRQWAFAHRGGVAGSLTRYSLAHLSGYALNFALLFVFVDLMGFPHQLVQAAAIGIVALFLFAAFRLFVFTAPKSAGP